MLERTIFSRFPSNGAQTNGRERAFSFEHYNNRSPQRSIPYIVSNITHRYIQTDLTLNAPTNDSMIFRSKGRFLRIPASRKFNSAKRIVLSKMEKDDIEEVEALRSFFSAVFASAPLWAFLAFGTGYKGKIFEKVNTVKDRFPSTCSPFALFLFFTSLFKSIVGIFVECSFTMLRCSFTVSQFSPSVVQLFNYKIFSNVKKVTRFSQVLKIFKTSSIQNILIPKHHTRSTPSTIPI